MKTAVYYSNNDVRIEERPIPEVGKSEILVQMKASGVCVADTMEWYLSPRAPLVLGHEATGIVVQAGQGVKNIKEGDRVFIHHHTSCFVCDHCLKGNYTMCNIFRKTNLKPGGFAEYFIASDIHVERETLVLPDELSYESGTLIEPLACVIHAIQKSNIKPGDSAVLIGSGVMGLMFIRALKYFGVEKIIVYEIIPWRAEKAIEFGASTVIQPLQDPFDEAERLKTILHSDGADKVFIVAKDVRAMELGLQLANRGGTVVIFATPMPNEYLRFYVSDAFFRELTVMLSYSASYIDTRTALKLLVEGYINGEKLITHRFPLEKLSDAILQTAGRGESLKCIVVP